MFTQLNPTIPLHVIGKGDGYAFAVIDYGQEHNLIWVTAIDATGEVWCAPNPRVRLLKNWTMGRRESPALESTGDVAREGPELCADCKEVGKAGNAQRN